MHSRDGTRRDFVRSTLGKLGREMADRTERRVVVERYFRPPGAVDEISFLSLCTRCDTCIEVCPPRALVRAPASAGLAAATPIIEMGRQPCTVCPDMPCAAACPTGALVRPERRWEGHRLGWLELVPERCIAFHEVECGVCARACPVGTQALSLDEKGRPVLKAEGCVGCGVCVRACVTTPSSLTLHHLTER
ncbi:MAG TPA: 4Fe-4S dicluster domain-containing protein [Gemmatimonadales bacterium]|nr:4Fe-4S dicluster domain-containing protein [Gemmatimonadales bacterium]